MTIVINFLTAFLAISSIVGVIWFFVNQSIWTRYISPIVSRKSKPIITFDNGTDVMSVSISTYLDIEEEVKKQLNKETQLLPEAHIQNPYDNPWVLLSQSPENYRIYNSQRGLYLKNKEQQIRNTVIEEFESKSLVPVKFVIKNKGKIPTGKCDIEINFSDDTVVFDKNSFVECIDCVMNKPMLAKGHSFLCLNLGTTEYKYKKFNEELYVKSPITLTMDNLNQYMTNRDTIPVFYIDSRITSKLTISWKIVEPAHPKPIIGELTLNINRN
mgnify:CR=1 FL=1